MIVVVGRNETKSNGIVEPRLEAKNRLGGRWASTFLGDCNGGLEGSVILVDDELLVCYEIGIRWTYSSSAFPLALTRIWTLCVRSSV